MVRVPGEGRTIALGDAGIVTLKATGADTDGTVSAYEFAVPPRTAGPPVHLHRNWHETFYVLAGEMTFLIDGERRAAPAGTLVYIPCGVPHTFWNEGDAPAMQLTVFTPSGIEDYFDDLTRVLEAPDDETRAAAEALMERHDMVVVPDARPAYGTLGQDPSDV